MKSNIELAKVAICKSIGTEVGEYGIDLFIQHHKDELNAADWIKATGFAFPSDNEILNSVLSNHEVYENNIDFTLPNNVTDYILSVSFDENGDVDDIAMES